MTVTRIPNDRTSLMVPHYSEAALPDIVSVCREIFLRRNEIVGKIGIDDAVEGMNRALAIEKYVKGRAEKEEALRAARVFETAVGAALGPAEAPGAAPGQWGGDKALLASDALEIPRVDRYRFRKMHEYRDAWEPELERRGMPRAEVLRIIDAYLKDDDPEPQRTGTVDDLDELASGDIKFGTIYADPPWLYANQGTRAATSNHYEGMLVEELCALPVNDLAADDAHLHLWTTNGFLFECPKIFDAWGFEFRSSFVWVKPQMGIGNYWRNSHEFLLTAVRGKAKRFYDKTLMSWGEFGRTRHSAKPEAIRLMLEKASPGPRLELFGRSEIDGWVVWGNEISRNLFVQAEKIA